MTFTEAVIVALCLATFFAAAAIVAGHFTAHAN